MHIVCALACESLASSELAITIFKCKHTLAESIQQQCSREQGLACMKHGGSKHSVLLLSADLGISLRAMLAS